MELIITRKVSYEQSEFIRSEFERLFKPYKMEELAQLTRTRIQLTSIFKMKSNYNDYLEYQDDRHLLNSHYDDETSPSGLHTQAINKMERVMHDLRDTELTKQDKDQFPHYVLNPTQCMIIKNSYTETTFLRDEKNGDYIYFSLIPKKKERTESLADEDVLEFEFTFGFRIENLTKTQLHFGMKNKGTICFSDFLTSFLVSLRDNELSQFKDQDYTVLKSSDTDDNGFFPWHVSTGEIMAQELANEPVNDMQEALQKEYLYYLVTGFILKVDTVQFLLFTEFYKSIPGTEVAYAIADLIDTIEKISYRDAWDFLYSNGMGDNGIINDEISNRDVVDFLLSDECLDFNMVFISLIRDFCQTLMENKV